MWVPGAKAETEKVSAAVEVSGAVAMGVEVSRMVTVPVGVPVVVVATWVRRVGFAPREVGIVRVVTVGAGVIVRVKGALWALVWVRSPG